MRILVGWDDAGQVDLMKMYLNVDESGVVVTTDHQKLLELARSGVNWDAILLTTSAPDYDTAYATFAELREIHPETPIIGACHQDDVYRIARYLTAGLRAYVIRDKSGDFMFLLTAIIEGAVQQVEAERERQIAEKLRREVDSVRQLQESIIPRDITTPDGYGLVARYESSQIQVIGGQPVTMAGGDYYDAFTLPDDSMIVLVGDASGHGMKACMSIMTMHTLIRMIRYDEFREPAHFVRYVNNQLSQQAVVNNEGGFITLLYGVLNPQTHEFRWASAGHQAPIIHNLATNEVEEVTNDPDAAGLPIGILDDAEYVTQRTVIPPNSRLLIYTDGLVEAFPADGDGHMEFGIDGVRSTMQRCRDQDLKACMQSLFDDSLAFTQGQGRHDDTSLVIVQRD